MFLCFSFFIIIFFFFFVVVIVFVGKRHSRVDMVAFGRRAANDAHQALQAVRRADHAHADVHERKPLSDQPVDDGALGFALIKTQEHEVDASQELKVLGGEKALVRNDPTAAQLAIDRREGFDLAFALAQFSQRSGARRPKRVV